MSTSTELTVVDAATYLALTKNKALTEAMETNLDGKTMRPDQLLNISMPSGGVTVFSWEDLQGTETAATLTGILAHVQLLGILWPYEMQAGEQQPVLITKDLEKAYINPLCDDFGEIDQDELLSYQQEDGSLNWPELPWNQWGSTSHNSRGKRAKEYRRLYLLREKDLFPIVLRISPASIKPFKKYSQQLTRSGIPHHHSVTEVGLKAASSGGNKYAEATFRLLGVLSQEHGDMIRDQYTLPIKQSEMDAAFGAVGKGNDGEDGENGEAG
jgi:hypothetical protein